MLGKPATSSCPSSKDPHSKPNTKSCGAPVEITRVQQQNWSRGPPSTKWLFETKFGLHFGLDCVFRSFKKKLWSNANILPAPTPFSNPRVQNVDFAKTFCRDPRRTSIPSVIICSTSFHTFPFFSYDTACKPMTTFSKHSWKTLGPGKGCHFKMGQSNLSTNDPGKGSLHVTLVPMLIHVESQHKSDAMFQHVRCWWSTKWILWSWKIITNIDSLQKALHITSFPILQKKSEGRCITCVCVMLGKCERPPLKRK